MNIKIFQLGPLGTNCYIIYQSNKALIIDPGGNGNIVSTFLSEQKLTPQAILLTHAHFDHIGAVDELRKKHDIQVYLHENEAAWLSDSKLNRSALSIGFEITTEGPEHFLQPGHLEIGNFAFEVLHTPGHSPGSTSFVFHDEEFVVSGDVLFQRGVGRTDLPGGDFSELTDSIRNKLYRLPNHFIVYPGHGLATSIKDEKQHNPFVPGVDE